MDEASVKEVFRQKLPSILTKTWMEDSDIVDLVMLMGYRTYLQKCDRNQLQNILSEAITDEDVVKQLVDYFSSFAAEQQKKIAQEKEEAQRRQQQAKNEQNTAKKEEANSKAKPKQIYKPKAKVPPKTEGQSESGVNIPDPEKRPKLEGEKQEGGDEVKQGQTAPVPLATQLINQGKVKCKYFPFCKNQNCQYFHPTEKCPYFPRCKFAQQCMYLHEACKYAQNCTRSNCFYDHPFKKKSDNPMLQLMKLAMGQGNRANKRPIRKRKPTQEGFHNQKAPTDKQEEEK